MPEKAAPKRPQDERKPPRDERKQLIVRGLIALAVIAVMLIVLSSWERLRRDDAPAPPPAPRLATPEALQSAAAGASAAAQSAPAAPAQSDAVIEESAAEETTGMPLSAATAPEAPATEAPPQPQEKSAERTTDKATEKTGEKALAAKKAGAVPHDEPAAPVHAAAETPRDKARVEDKDSNHGAPRLVVQAEPAPPGPIAPPGRAFAVQVGIFSNPANAEELQSRLRAAGIPAQLETRVAVGPFKSRDEALRTQAKIRELGLGKGQLVTVK